MRSIIIITVKEITKVYPWSQLNNLIIHAISTYEIQATGCTKENCFHKYSVSLPSKFVDYV